MTDYLLIGGKTLLFYFILITVMRLMGKREVGELSIFDMVVYFVISELLSISIAEPQDDPFQTIVAIVVIVGLQLLTAFLAMRFEFIRHWVEGSPTFLIIEGKINQDEMRKQRYTIDDLMSQLHEKNFQSPDEIAFAILENSGILNLIPYADRKVEWPHPFIKDGTIDRDTLTQSKHDENWLINEMHQLGYSSEKDVFIALKLTDRWLVIPKQSMNH